MLKVHFLFFISYIAPCTCGSEITRINSSIRYNNKVLRVVNRVNGCTCTSRQQTEQMVSYLKLQGCVIAQEIELLRIMCTKRAFIRNKINKIPSPVYPSNSSTSVLV